MVALTPPASFTLLGVTFHWYGLLVGLGIVLGWLLVSKKAEQIRGANYILDRSIGWLILGGLLGARTWHVFTDWQLYQNNLISVLYLWNGGMSILGAIAGVLVTWFILCRTLTVSKQQRWLVPDLLAYGAPVAQIIGRIGNWINQELVGHPTGLPWGISIEPDHRPAGFENEEFYHPLFAYEMIALAIVWRIVWLRFRTRLEAFGTGRVFLTYLGLYLGFRFLLDFLRLEKGGLLTVGVVQLGINQVLILIILAALGLYWWYMRSQSAKKLRGYSMSSVLGLTLLVFVVAGGVWLIWNKLPQNKINVADRMDLEAYTTDGPISSAVLTGIRDRSKIALVTDTGTYTAEVVNTTESIRKGLSGRAEIGSDAMLFAFPEKTVQTFWMPDMQFDLDIVWVEDGIVRAVTEHVPAPDLTVPHSELARYSSGSEVNQVIEVPAGRSAEMGLLPGKTVIFTGL